MGKLPYKAHQVADECLNYSVLKIEIIWRDDDMLELRLSASNADFAGQANFYAALDEPLSFAKH
jgi:hypothetical protein